MSEFPGRLARRRVLADGRIVVVRPVCPGDEAAEREFLRGLSERSRRLRFMSFASAPTDELARFYTHIDYDRHMAFVCEAEVRGRTAIVGEARYLANPDGRSCELGIVIADDWHHTGIAQLLLAALMQAARARRFDTIEGLVLSENKDMLDFVAALGFAIHPVPEAPATVRVVRKL